MKTADFGAWAERLREGFQKYKFVLLVLLAGLVLLLLPSFGGETETVPETTTESLEDPFGVATLEARMEQALAQIDGVGEVKVVLTLRSGPRQILAQDTQSSQGSGEELDTTVSTVVVSKGSSSEETVTIQQLSPQYQGALVVCSGGGDPSVQLKVVEAVSALTGLGADKISVCKGK